MQATRNNTTGIGAGVKIFAGRPVILHDDHGPHDGVIVGYCAGGALVDTGEDGIKGADWSHIDLQIEADDFDAQATPEGDDIDPRDYSFYDESVSVREDGVAFGVDARIGARVRDGSCNSGIVTALTDEMVIWRDDKTGRECAERYGHMVATLRPPANLPASKPGRLTPRDLVKAGQTVHCEDSPGCGAWDDYEALEVSDVGVKFLFRPYEGEPEERLALWTAVKLYPAEVIKALTA